MSAEIDREIAEPSEENEKDPAETSVVNGPEQTDLTHGQTPAQATADDETRSPEEEGGENPPV